MSNSYIKFKMANTEVQKTPDSIGKELVKEIFTTVIPIANPDFENKIGEVRYWLIEFEGDSFFPNREIGLDSLNKPIMIMPWRKNYGYWTDNNLVMEDFRSHFSAKNISREEFEKNWKLFEKAN